MEIAEASPFCFYFRSTTHTKVESVLKKNVLHLLGSSWYAFECGIVHAASVEFHMDSLVVLTSSYQSFFLS